MEDKAQQQRVSVMGDAAKEAELAQLVQQRKALQDEVHVLTNETLPRLNQDKSGVLEIIVRGVRNAQVDSLGQRESDVDHEKFLVTLEPLSVVADGQRNQVELTGLGQSAKFSVSSLEAKAVVCFGADYQHEVHIPLHNKYKEAELAQLSGWHTSKQGEDTEHPQITDVSEVPQIQLRFHFTRENKEEMVAQTDKLRELQEAIATIKQKEKALKSSTSSRTASSTTSRSSSAPQRGAAASKAKGEGVLTRVFKPLGKFPEFGRAVAWNIWRRRAIVMFFGGALAMHFLGDDLAV